MTISIRLSTDEAQELAASPGKPGVLKVKSYEMLFDDLAQPNRTLAGNAPWLWPVRFQARMTFPNGKVSESDEAGG